MGASQSIGIVRVYPIAELATETVENNETPQNGHVSLRNALAEVGLPESF